MAKTSIDDCACLLDLYMVFTSTFYAGNYVDVPSKALSHCVFRQALKYYETNDVQNSDVFHVPISLPSVSPLLKG